MLEFHHGREFFDWLICWTIQQNNMVIYIYAYYLLHMQTKSIHWIYHWQISSKSSLAIGVKVTFNVLSRKHTFQSLRIHVWYIRYIRLHEWLPWNFRGFPFLIWPDTRSFWGIVTISYTKRWLPRKDMGSPFEGPDRLEKTSLFLEILVWKPHLRCQQKNTW